MSCVEIPVFMATPLPTPVPSPTYPGINQVKQAVNSAILTLDTDAAITPSSHATILSLLAAVTILGYNPGVAPSN